jgi:HEPN domain-containing protein
VEQADKDLEAAKDSKKIEHFEWACFQAEQSAEKALKSFLLYLNIDTSGRLVLLLSQLKKILEDFCEESKNENLMSQFDLLKEKCQELDMHYIQSRYPNRFVSGHPAEYYNKKIATKCINYAESINQYIKKEIEKISSSECIGGFS